MHKTLPQTNRLRWEISLALILKVLLLTGLWFLIFRWPAKPEHPTDIAARFALPSLDSSNPPQPPQEFNHVR